MGDQKQKIEKSDIVAELDNKSVLNIYKLKKSMAYANTTTFHINSTQYKLNSNIKSSK